MVIVDPRYVPGLIAWYSADFEATRVADGVRLLAGLKDLSGRNNNAVYQGEWAMMRYAGGPGTGKRLDFAGGYFNLPDLLTGKVAAEVFSTIKTTTNCALWLLGEKQTWMTWSNPQIIEGFGRSNAQGAKSYNYTTQSPFSWCTYNVWSAPGDWSANINGVVGGSDAVNTSAWSTPASAVPINIGNQNAGGGAYVGGMGVFLLYDHKLTAGERADVNTWITANASGGLATAPDPNPSTGSRLDQTMAALVGKGYTTGSIQDRQAAYLRAKTGLVKTSADMQKADGRVVIDLLSAASVT